MMILRELLGDLCGRSIEGERIDEIAKLIKSRVREVMPKKKEIPKKSFLSPIKTCEIQLLHTGFNQYHTEMDKAVEGL